MPTEAEYREAFKAVDTDGSGAISQKELKALFVQLGLNPSEKELDTLFKEVDRNGDGEVSFDEFVVMIKALMKMLA